MTDVIEVIVPGPVGVIEVVVPGETQLVEIVVPGVRGPQGPVGPVGGSYTHTQLVPTLVWTVQHNLGHPPGIPNVYSDSGVSTDPIAFNVNDNVTLLTFLDATAGTADFS